MIDQCQDSEKRMTIEALHISRRKPQLNTRDEYKIRDYKRNRFVKLKLLPIFKTNVFEFYVHRQVKTVLQIVKS